jgi:hypothetical protein
MMSEYLYLGDYDFTGRRLGLEAFNAVMWQDLKINVRVYVLALKLCMEELKLFALKRTAALLAGSYSLATLRSIGLRRLAEIGYPNTPDADHADEREEQSTEKRD